MKKITIVYGTRPEFIKLIPLIRALKEEKTFQLQVICSNQHTDLLDTAHEDENFYPNINLNISRLYGDLNELCANITSKLHDLSLKDKRPDLLIVHGDTSTSFAAALFAFQFKIPIAHIEAGLRSHNLHSPFPEEFYRQSISKIASFNFVPTKHEFLNLLNEGVKAQTIYIVGNTIVDAIRAKVLKNSNPQKRILISIHRRESKEYLDNYLNSIDELAYIHSDFSFEFIIHPSNKLLNIKLYQNIKFIQPMSHVNFLNYLNSSMLFITDSGGGQEEAGYLGVRTLVVRDVSERQDGLSQNIKLIGNCAHQLKIELQDFLTAKIFNYQKTKINFASPANLIKNTLLEILVEKEVVCVF